MRYHENHENIGIQTETQESNGNHKFHMKNYKNLENIRIPYENHKGYKNHRIPYMNN